MSQMDVAKISFHALIQDAKDEVLSQYGALDVLLQRCQSAEGRTSALVEKEQLQEWIKSTREERRKLEEMELTIAFVGTMNAGKSTVINAIVGMEVLPNRGTAMTALPTVISHAPGATEPLLRLPCAPIFEQAVAEIKKRLSALDRKAQGGCLRMKIEEQDQILAAIRDHSLGAFVTEYRGQAEVFRILMLLNDIIQICIDPHFIVDSPLNMVMGIEDMPRIEIEFTYLKDQNSSGPGKLSLIDTPGPNQARQMALINMVKAQLRSASAVISVMDYTQFNAEAQVQIQEWIDDLRQYREADLFVIVNKFDNYSPQRDLNAEQTKEYVRHRLMPDRFDEHGKVTHSVAGRVYPVSAKNAFYATQGLRELYEKGCLPNSNSDTETRWVEELCKLAYGVNWSRFIKKESKEDLMESCRQVWDEALMREPLQEVFGKALENVAPMCLTAAVDGLLSIISELQNSLKIRRGSLMKEIGELQQAAERMKNRMERMKQAKEKAEHYKQEALCQVDRELRFMIGELWHSAEKELFQSLDDVRRHAGEITRPTGTMKEKSFLGKIFQTFLGGKREDEPYTLIFGDEPIVYNSIENAREAMYALNQSLEPSIYELFQDRITQLNPIVNQIQLKFWEKMEQEIRPYLDEAKVDIKGLFDIDMEFQSPSCKAIKIDMDLAERAQITETRSTKEWVSHERRWYTLWLYEHQVIHTVEITQYVIDPKVVREMIRVRLKEVVEHVKSFIYDYITSFFNNNFEACMRLHDKALRNLLTEILSGIQFNQQHKKDQEVILDEIRMVEEEVKNLQVRAAQHKEFLRGTDLHN